MTSPTDRAARDELFAVLDNRADLDDRHPMIASLGQLRSICRLLGEAEAEREKDAAAADDALAAVMSQLRQAEAARDRALRVIEERDKFIVDRGLWSDFLNELAAFDAGREG